MSTGTIYPYPIVDQPFYNNTATTIKAGDIVAADTPVDKKMTIDPYATTRGPLEAEGDTTIIPVKVATTASSTNGAPAVGCALTEIKAGEWGSVRVYGPCLAACAETATKPNLTAYGVDNTTDGRLKDVAPGAAVYVVAFQVGASGTTTAGDKRKVFMLGDRDQLGREACEFGTFV